MQPNVKKGSGLALCSLESFWTLAHVPAEINVVREEGAEG